MYRLTLSKESVSRNIELIEWNRRYVDGFELRVDRMAEADGESIRRIIEKADRPVIASLRAGRRKGEDSTGEEEPGGVGKKLSAERREELWNLLREAEAAGAEYLDIDELLLPEGEYEIEKKNKFILSRYIERAPSEGDIRWIERNAEKGILTKLVVYPRSLGDVVDLYEAAGRLSRIEEKILYAEGGLGIFSRILFRRFGSLWMYCEEGLLEAEDVSEMYRAKEIDEETNVFGIVGNPVSHSKSPQIHNLRFREGGWKAVYLPFQVDDLYVFFRLADMLPVKGVSVTIPHKSEVIRYADELTGEVEAIGACNTLVRTEGVWIGSNTDYEGFLSPLDPAAMKAPQEPEKTQKTEAPQESGEIATALVVGAGGAARTVVHALRDLGTEVYITNRTEEKARRLAEEAGCKSIPMDELNSGKIGKGSGSKSSDNGGGDSGGRGFDLIVQTTSVGMYPNVEADPLPGYAFSGRETVYDIIYTPEKTRFLKRAEADGCRVIGGLEMLRTQAEAQFRLFTRGPRRGDG